ncbi:MAG: leucine-rich repeat domain-containing protein, partial [Mycoplasmataceae bacterium]|nr:leucine-rich repeat domain-containing protein [Mycoplasmataceae bacterium]
MDGKKHGTCTIAGAGDSTNRYQAWNLIIPNTVKIDSKLYDIISITNQAFRSNATLTGTLTLPNTLVTIGAYAFYGRYSLSGTLTLPNSVTTIGDNAFYEARGFNHLIIPNSVTTIG